MTLKEIENVTVQLKSLANEYRLKAEYIDMAVALHETGYKQDVEAVNTAVAEIVTAKDSEIANLQTQIETTLIKEIPNEIIAE